MRNCLAGALIGSTLMKLALTSAANMLKLIPASSMSSSPFLRTTSDRLPGTRRRSRRMSTTAASKRVRKRACLMVWPAIGAFSFNVTYILSAVMYETSVKIKLECNPVMFLADIPVWLPKHHVMFNLFCGGKRITGSRIRIMLQYVSTNRSS